VVDPSWGDPSDTTYSRRHGGRWNEPDRPGRPGFGALYLNATIDVARSNARRLISSQFGENVTIDDLAPQARPELQQYDVIESEFVDVVSRHAISQLGLAERYPLLIPHPPCQGIAAAAHASGETGLAVLSATMEADGEELVIFDRVVDALTVRRERLPFQEWY
jgi:hypothetical protein